MAYYSALRDAFNDLNKTIGDQADWNERHAADAEDRAWRRQQEEFNQQNQLLRRESAKLQLEKQRADARQVQPGIAVAVNDNTDIEGLEFALGRDKTNYNWVDGAVSSWDANYPNLRINKSTGLPEHPDGRPFTIRADQQEDWDNHLIKHGLVASDPIKAIKNELNVIQAEINSRQQANDFAIKEHEMKFSKGPSGRYMGLGLQEYGKLDKENQNIQKLQNEHTRVSQFLNDPANKVKLWEKKRDNLINLQNSGAVRLDKNIAQRINQGILRLDGKINDATGRNTSGVEVFFNRATQRYEKHPINSADRLQAMTFNKNGVQEPLYFRGQPGLTKVVYHNPTTGFSVEVDNNPVAIQEAQSEGYTAKGRPDANSPLHKGTPEQKNKALALEAIRKRNPSWTADRVLAEYTRQQVKAQHGEAAARKTEAIKELKKQFPKLNAAQIEGKYNELSRVASTSGGDAAKRKTAAIAEIRAKYPGLSLTGAEKKYKQETTITGGTTEAEAKDFIADALSPMNMTQLPPEVRAIKGAKGKYMNRWQRYTAAGWGNGEASTQVLIDMGEGVLPGAPLSSSKPTTQSAPTKSNTGTIRVGGGAKTKGVKDHSSLWTK
jgi:hypothetical protein